MRILNHAVEDMSSYGLSLRFSQWILNLKMDSGSEPEQMIVTFYWTDHS
jgi:hypothetical protein